MARWRAGFCSASLGRPLAIRDFDFDLRHPYATSSSFFDRHSPLRYRIAIDDDVLDRWDSKPLGTPSPAPSQHLSGLFEHFSKIAAILGRTLEKLYSVRAASLTPQEMDPIVKELTAEHEACELFNASSALILKLTCALDRSRCCSRASHLVRVLRRYFRLWADLSAFAGSTLAPIRSLRSSVAPLFEDLRVQPNFP